MADKPKSFGKPKPSATRSPVGLIIFIILVSLALSRTNWGARLLGTATSTPEYNGSTTLTTDSAPPDKPTVIIGK